MSLELVVSNISKSYSSDAILNNCSFTFNSSGIYALMGPNGSGKSTFLRICALLETPDSGDISFYSEGKPVIKDISLMRRITLLLPKIGVFNTTVYKNVVYGLNIRNPQRNDITSRAENALDFVGMLQKKNQKALTLSSGETKRLGIARALVIEPEIFFLDEPTASVDQQNTEIIEEIIQKLKKEGRSTIVITTHDTAQAERLADKLLFIKHGQISGST
ncbi:MAG TPA: ABC transporter ATP-binding protein [Thermodesulfovibrionales bacterium]|nr:ABC transporter ATP-binding protein [Thermodesulfovibrionales bacterium]